MRVNSRYINSTRGTSSHHVFLTRLLYVRNVFIIIIVISFTVCRTNMCWIALLSNLCLSIIDKIWSIKPCRDVKSFLFYFFLRMLYGSVLVYLKCIFHCSIQYKCWKTSLAECGTRRTRNFICPKVSRPEAHPSPFHESSMFLIG